MTDLDTLRRALRAQQDLGQDGRAAVDLPDIMARGRRLRLRRRLTAAGGAVCVAAIVFGVVSGISQPTRPSPVPGQRPAGSTGTVHPPSPRPTHVSTPVPAPSASGQPVTHFPAVPSEGPGTSSPAPAISQGASSVPTPSGAASASPTLTPSASASSVPTPSRAAGSVPVDSPVATST